MSFHIWYVNNTIHSGGGSADLVSVALWATARIASRFKTLFQMRLEAFILSIEYLHHIQMTNLQITDLQSPWHLWSFVSASFHPTVMNCSQKKSTITHSGTRQRCVCLNHSVTTPIKQSFHRPSVPLGRTFSQAVYPSKWNKRVKVLVWIFSALFQWNFHCLQGYQVIRWQFTLSQENRKSCLHSGWYLKEAHRAWCHLSLKPGNGARYFGLTLLSGADRSPKVPWITVCSKASSSRGQRRPSVAPGWSESGRGLFQVIPG